MILIKGGNVHDGKGNVLENTDILIEGSLIKDVGKNLSAGGAAVVDAAGMEIFPGFVDPCNKWGAAGPELRDNDMNEHTDPVSPQLNVIYAFDHDGMVYQNAFEYGISTMGLMPSYGNVLGGQAAVYKTYGKHPYKMMIKEKAAMAASVSSTVKDTYSPEKKAPATRMGMIAMLDAALIKAKSHGPGKDYDPKSEALLPVVKGDMPLFVHTASKADMDAVDLLMEKHPEIKVVYIGAYEISCANKNIANKKYAAIIGDSVGINKNVDVQYGDINKMLKDGAKIALGNCKQGGGSKESTLWNAILFHKYGIDAEEVLKMITSIPAELLGVQDKVGSIEEGKSADLSIWTNHPMKTYSAVIQNMYIDGEDILSKEVSTECW